jgi:anaerobic magnesium-protoporphyrin IX monomethyl ester cyclase
MKSKSLLLISLLPGSHRHLSCLTLFAIAKAHGIDTRLLFIPDRAAYDEAMFVAFLQTHSFDVIGFSVTTGDFRFCSSLTATIRRCQPQAHVVWGGIHPTSLPEECLPFVDSLCIGESERTLPALMERLHLNEETTSLPGIAWKNAHGKVILNPPPPMVTNLDSLPLNHYDFERFFVMDDGGLHRFTLGDYRRYSKHDGEDYTLMTSRSCPYNCSYCINSYLNKLNRSTGKIRRRSVDHVLREIAQARAQIPTLRFINFIDDIFLTSKAWTREFCQKYSEQVGLPFIIRTVPTTITETDIAELKEVGLAVVQTGIQSGSARTHEQIFHRHYEREAILRAAQVLYRHRVKGMYDVIIENDFELDTDRDLTIELLLDLPKPFEVNLFALTVFPRTDLERMYHDAGLRPRIDPYQSDYLDYNEADFYYQLASIIPSTPTGICRDIFRHRTAENRSRLDQLYRECRPRLRNVSRMSSPPPPQPRVQRELQPV